MFHPPWRWLIASLVLGLLAALAASPLSDATSLSTARSTAEAFVQPEVHRALAQQPTVRVLISLREPAALRATKLNIASLRAQVASRQAAVLAALAQTDFVPIYRYQAVPALAGRMSKGSLEALAGRSDVVAVTLDGRGSAATSRSLPIIHADEVQSSGLTGAGVVVAVLDTGVDTDHPDLMGDILYETCFLSEGGCPEGDHPAEDDHGHGTNVTGIITGDGNVAPIGVAPGAQIAAYKILDDAGDGFFSDWLAALDDIIASHPEVDIVNMSLQSPVPCPASALATAIATLRKLGVPTFSAAGNHGSKSSFTVPACITDTISVGATYDASLGRVDGWKSTCVDLTTSVDQVACWSDSHRTLDLLAPGAAITSTGMGGGTITFFGTSQAAPHAAGVAALLLEAHPDLDADQIEARLEATGTLITDDLHDSNPSTNRTTPRIDARVALLADDEDTDGDGCANVEEYGADPRLGGQRNPFNPWDFYDVNGDRVVTVFDDILAVINAFGPDSGPNYDPALDRSPAPPSADPWRMGPPDGTIDLANDILGVASQFGHTCVGPP